MTESTKYRYERKFLISSMTKHDVENLIRHNPRMFSEVFHKRCINNIYFDSPRLNNYFENVFGVMQRTKIRIRWYGELFGEIKQPILLGITNSVQISVSIFGSNSFSVSI